MVRSIVACFLALLGCCSIGSGQRCPYNWYTSPRGVQCYRFVRATKLTWQDARSYCQSHGGDLLKLTSAAERDWVLGQVRNTAAHFHVSNSKWWVGLNNREFLAKWEWADGSPAGNFIPWAPGEPNNHNNEERCAEIVSGTKFNDQACSDQDFFICSRPRNLPLACDTDNGWETLNGRCYKVRPQKMSWDDAMKACSDDGGRLAEVEISAVEATVHDFASVAGQALWIGLHSLQVGPTATWMWSNGSLLTTTPYWNAIPHLTSASLNSSCVSVSNSLPDGQDWNAESCSTNKAFVCQKPEGVCFNGWVGHSAHCYQFDPQFRLSFTAAKTFCEKQGAELLRIDSTTDQQFIATYLDEFQDSEATTIWLGLSDMNNDTGPYRWTNGDPMGHFQYWAYAHGQPPNTKSKLDCGYLAASDTRGKWRVTSSCQAARAVICRIAMGKTVLPMPPTPRPQYGCPPNWHLHGSSCYRTGDTPFNQIAARGQCKATPGADLAVIPSADVQSFVSTLVQDSQNYYIGLNDKAAEGQFVWNDQGSPVYTNWRPGEPNDANHQESCVVQVKGGWNDISCSVRALYVCSMPASNVVPVTPTPTNVGIFGDWTVKCGPSWESNPVTDYCYMFSDQPLIWTDALLQCRVAHGDLVSISSLEEQSYLAGRLKLMNSVAVWTGANDRRQETGWAWTSGAGFGFFNWAPNQPSGGRAGQSSDCVAMLTTTAQWDDLSCNIRNGYVCKKKGNVPHTRPPKVTTKAPPAGMTLGCGRNWKQFQSNCYVFARVQTSISFDAADIRCRRWGGQLASIHSRAEQNFIVANLPNATYDYNAFWIGLSDRVLENNFQWNDKTPMDYTNWNTGEPNNYRNKDEDCVDVYLKAPKSKQVGAWNDETCSATVDGFICKRPLWLVPINQTPPPTTVGCPPGSRGYGPYCYKLVTTVTHTWDDANSYCSSSLKGTLATISDKFVQAYLSSRLVLYNGNTWIGLSDKDNPGTYTWASGHAVTYTAWARNHTGNERSTCVAMRGTPIQGLWVNQDCSQTNGYVCQFPRQGYTVPPTPPTPYPNVPCPAGWTENYAYCLKAFTDGSQRRYWMDASTFCQSLGGNLASFHQAGNDSVVASLIDHGRFTLWIGLNDRDTEGGHTWSDGSPVDYTNWAPHQPDDWNKDEDCVVYTGGGSWNDENCYGIHNFLCALPRGTSPATTVAPPVAVQSPQCGSGPWLYYNNNCYLFSPDTGDNRTLNWYDSKAYCNGLSATLASIHSMDESRMIAYAAQSLSSGNFWIGLSMFGNAGLSWSDGSPVNFVFWRPNEPNNYMGAEKCVMFYKTNGQWNDDMCTNTKGFVCKKPLNGVANIIPPANAPGGCPTGFSRVAGGRNKCFYLVNSVRLNWTDAYAYCRRLGAGVDIASIEDVYENDFVLTMPTNNGSSIWIGLSDRRGKNRFFWEDNTPVVYTSWDLNEPTSARVSDKNDTQDCVVFRSYKRHEGKWADKECSVLRSFLCQTKQDPNIPIHQSGPGSCRQGYHPFHNSCYKTSSAVKTWSDAGTDCQKDGGHLTSVNDAFEAAFVVTLAASAAPFWIGLSDNQVAGLYYWSDGSRMVWANWGHREPSYGQAGGNGCVVSDENGQWNDTGCSQAYHYVCKISSVTVSPTNPSSDGSCADPTWTPIGDYCYYANVNSGRSWPEANFDCQQRGMQLASVHSQKEFMAVYQMVKNAPVRNTQFTPNIWIGMSKDENSPYLWSDGTPANFLYWAPGEPASLGANGQLQECVEFGRSSGAWNTANCFVSRGYACKATKVYSTKPLPTVAVDVGPDGNPVIQPLGQHSVASSSSGLSSGGIAGIVLGLVCGALLVAFGLVYLKRSGKIPNSNPPPEGRNVPEGFDNTVYISERQESDI